jgi:hypothetical protein
VAPDGRDEEVDGVRAQVDGGTDARARRHASGAVAWLESVPVVDARRRVAGALVVPPGRLRRVAGRLRVVAARVVVAFAVGTGAADDPLAAALAAGFLVVVDLAFVVVAVFAPAGRPRRVVVGVVVAAVALVAAAAPLRARVVGALAFDVRVVPAGPLRVVPAAPLRAVPAVALRLVAGCALVGDRRRFAAGFGVVDAAARGRPRAGPVRTGDTAWAAWAAALPTSRTAPPTAPAAVPAAPRAMPPIRTTSAATSAAASTAWR